MSNKIKLVIYIIISALLVGLIAYMAGFFSEKIEPEKHIFQQQISKDGLYVVKLTQEAVIEEATGTIQPKIETIISSRLIAAILDITVRAGDLVKKNDTLVVLDSRDLKARLEQAKQGLAAIQARLPQLEADYERASNLFPKGAMSKADLDRAKSNLDSQKAEYNRAQRNVDEATTALSYSILKSPIDGRIIERFTDPGDTISPGIPILKIYSPDQLRLDANVRESLTSSLSIGDELEAYIDAIHKTVPVTIDEIVPSADPGSRSVIIKVILNSSEGVIPGMFGRLLIKSHTVNRLYIPEALVQRIGQLEYVHIMNDAGQIEKRFIRTGLKTDDNMVDILSGLDAGEKILKPAQ